MNAAPDDKPEDEAAPAEEATADILAFMGRAGLPKAYRLTATHETVPINSIVEWAQDFQNNRRVAESFVGRYHVSTVFLGLDHSFGRGRPLLFETMVFQYFSARDVDMDRYTTWDEAVAGHDAMVARIVASYSPLGLFFEHWLRETMGGILPWLRRLRRLISKRR